MRLRRGLRISFGFQVSGAALTREKITIGESRNSSSGRRARVEPAALDGRVATLVVLVESRDSAVSGWVGREDLFQSRNELVLSPFGELFGAEKEKGKKNKQRLLEMNRILAYSPMLQITASSANLAFFCKIISRRAQSENKLVARDVARLSSQFSENIPAS